MNTKTSHTLTQSWNSKKKKTKSKTRETCETLSIVVAYRFCTALIRAGAGEEAEEEGAECIARTSSGKFCELRIRSVCGGRREGFKLNFKCKINAQVELELCLQGQHGSKCSSRLCHTHTHTHSVALCVARAAASVICILVALQVHFCMLLKQQVCLLIYI